MSKLRIVPPGRPLNGALALPGSKSITNRALLLAGLSEGTSRITGALRSEDTRHMAIGLRHMGVTLHQPDETTFVVTGRRRLMRPERDIFLGNAGTAMRFLTAAAALCEGKVYLDGNPQMRKRPIAPLVDALGKLGVKASAPSGCPPVTVEGEGRLKGGKVSIDASLSSQFASALLLAAGAGDGPVEVALKGKDIGARGYIDLTIEAMRAFGGQVEAVGDAAWKVTPTGYRATEFAVEPDASAATYPWAWAAITGGELDVGLASQAFSQPDATAFAHIAAFPKMPATIDGSQIQDAVPTLAVLAMFNAAPVRFTKIGNLRVKESDRIAVLAEGINRIRAGMAKVEGDDLIVTGDPGLKGAKGSAVIDPHGDHRMAMAFAVAGLTLDGLEISDPSCVDKTWPGHWKALQGLGVTLA